MQTVFLFSGQGSQYYQMGRSAYDERGVFGRSMHELGEVVRPLPRQSVIAAIYDDRGKSSDTFDELLLTHPVFMVCCVHSKVVQALERDYFREIARRPIEFERTVARLETTGSYNYVDAGPSGTLARILKYTLPPGTCSRIFPTFTQHGREQSNFAALHAGLESRGGTRQ